jgi:hypothetical protein
MNKKDVKIFLISFVAFIIASFVYNNFTTDTIAKGIGFREITVKIVGDVELNLDCAGLTVKNTSEFNNGRGSRTSNNCTGTGKFKAEFPQQRFVEQPDQLK